MTQRRILLYLAIFAISIVSSGTALTQKTDELREEFHQTYKLTPNGRVSLENINGAVHIKTWDQNEVKVDALKHGYNQERLNEAKIEIESDADSLRIKTMYPDRNLSFSSDDDRRNNNPASVEYTLTVPRNARIDSVEVINGAVDIRSVSGSVKATSINGEVRADGLAGDVKLSTVNGAAHATFGDLTNVRNVSVGSVNGSVELVIPSDVNAQIRANTVHGAIKNDFGIPVHHGQYVGRDLSATLGRGGIQIRLDNVNGEINIRHAADNRPLSNVSNLLKDEDSEGVDDDRSAAKEATRIAREANRAAREAEASIDIDKEAIKAQIESSKEIQKEAMRAQREAQREVARAQREVMEVNRNVMRAYGTGGNGADYRLVERDNKTFTVGQSPKVSVQTFDGTVTVRTWDKNEVSCSITKRAADEQSLKRISVEATQAGNTVTINAKGNDGPNRDSYNVRGNVNLEIYVPKTASLVIGSGDGKLDVDGVSGDLQLRTGDGSIFVTDSKGHLKVETGDGSVRVQGFDGDANIRTGDGRIVLQGKFNQLSAQTGDGAISLELPPDANASVEAHGDNIVNESNGTEEPGGDKHIRRFRLGRGGSLLKLQTGDGRIVLRNGSGGSR